MSKWRRTSQYRLWRILCKRRDGYRCVVTGSTKNLEVHHLDSGSYFPDKRYDVNNGVTINRNVHLDFHWYYKKSTKEKCTHKDWLRYLRGLKYKTLITKED